VSGYSIPRRPDGAPEAPLSWAQEGMWLTERVLPEFARYTGLRAFRLSGRIDLEALAVAVACLGQRHEALRTVFPLVDGVPRQRLRPDLALETVDLRGEPDPGKAADDRIDAAASSHLDVTDGPLFRVILLRRADDLATLVLVAHHLVVDLLSWPILLNDVAEFYEARREGRQPTLPELPIRPSDHAEWQRGRRDLPEVRAQVAGWCDRLAGIPPVLDLPIDRRRLPGRARGDGLLRVPLPAATAQAVTALGRAEGATLLVTTLAALAALLQRYTREEKLTIGVPVAGDRMRPEIEHLVGMFVTSFPVPLDLSGDPGFRTVMGRAKRAIFGAMANEDAPYELLMQTIRPERGLATMPYQQVSLNIRYPSERSFVLGGLRTEALPVRRWAPLGDLTLTVDAATADVELVWIYDSEMFSAATVDQMSRQYLRLLDEVTADPDRQLGDLLLRPAAPATAAPSPEGTITSRFAEWATRTPRAIAVGHGDEQLSYAELDARSDAVAHELRRRGVRREDTVGVCMPRGVDVVVVYLGVLKAGGAYVPLDLGYPEARRAEMLVGSGAKVVVTGAGATGGDWCGDAVVLAAGDLPLRAEPGARPLPAGHPDTLAYVMFTSGSTGRPKGVAISHRGVLGLVVDANHVKVRPSDRVAQTANLCSDNTTFEVWAPLLNGASVHVLDRSLILSPRELAAAVESRGITVLSVASALVNHDSYLEPLAGTSLRALYFGGEAASPYAIRRLLALGFRGEAVHTYGPTETTMLATYHPVTVVDEGVPRLPVGTAVSATEILIVDDCLRPVASGLPGEMCIAGDRLARGYHGAPAATADRFFPHPTTNRPGQRLYRTGDLARQLPDGGYEILGRLDRQLKIRGFRIEPGEIEGALTAQPGVAEAVVVKVRTGDIDTLAAYVSPENGAELRAGALLDRLRETLPGHLVPAALGVLDRLPLTPSGKVDRDALPVLSAGSAGSGGALPTSPWEEVIAEAVCELLELESIARDDDFDRVGGSSLFIVQLAVRLEGEGLDIPMEYLLSHQTVAELAAWADARSSEEAHG
jgi:amino acid adenylation domain-containing protein